MSNVFEKDFEKRFAKLKIQLKKSEDKIQQLMRKAKNTSKVMPNSYWRGITIGINDEYRKINKSFGAFAKKEIPMRYKNSVFQMHNKIQGLKSITAKFKKNVTDLIRTDASRQIVRALYEDAIAHMSAGTFSGKQNISRFIRKTQQTLIDEQFVNRIVAEGFEQGNLRISQRLLRDEFYANMVNNLENKKFIRVNGRNYKPSYYAEMVSRTKFHEAHSHAALATASNYDTELVIVSSHNTRTAICIPFEGKVYSTKGGHSMFPPLQDIPPFHSNCLHLIYPQFESGMNAQGTYKEFSDFSLGKASRPPHPSNFIPVSQRGIK